MTFTIPSPFTMAPPPFEATVELSEAGLPDVLARAAELMARMRTDRAASRVAAAAASDRPGDAAAALAAAQRALDTARSAEAKARRDVLRAGQVGDGEAIHWARQRFASAQHALRAAEDAARDHMAAHAGLEREGAIAKRRAEFLDASIAAAERAAALLAGVEDGA